MALEKGKRSVLHVMRVGPGINTIPLNDVSVFLFERGVDPATIKEFIERTSAAVQAIEEKALQAAVEKKALDDAWEAKRQERRDAKNKS